VFMVMAVCILTTLKTVIREKTRLSRVPDDNEEGLHTWRGCPLERIR
jgi:hypothetical protein